MFRQIAAFELRYQLSSPVFWVVTILFFLLTFGGMTIDEISLGSSGSIFINSPSAIVSIHLIFTIFYMFATTAFVANAIVRDDESGFGSMVRSTRVRKFDYLIGRFIGAWLAVAISFLSVPIAIFLGSLMPWLDPETVGPNHFIYYAFAYGYIALPGLWITAALFFGIATITRSMIYSYLGVIIFFISYISLNILIDSQPTLREFAAYIEPFGAGAYNLATRYWTPAESNSMLPAIGGIMLYNKLIWLSVTGVILGLTYRWFQFTKPSISKRKAARSAAKASKLARQKPIMVSQLPRHNIGKAPTSLLLERTKFEAMLTLKSPAFFILILIGLFNSITSLSFANTLYGTPTHPLTFAIIATLQGTFGITPIIVAIFYAGELVWRDYERKFHEIIDATPLPNWAYLLPKAIAITFVLLTALIISAIAAIIMQLIKGVPDLALDQYLFWYLLPGIIDYALLAILAVFIQAISPNKYIGWAAMVLYIVATIIFSVIGLDHPLYLFGNTNNPLYSDMNGNNINIGASWLRLYWAAAALILAVMAHLLWRRGTEFRFMPRLRRVPQRLRSSTGALFVVALFTMGASGGFIYYNMNILNEYSTNEERNKILAEYEKKYLKYENIAQPTITDVTLKVDIYPDTLLAHVSGAYDFINRHETAINTLHVRFTDPNLKVVNIDVGEASLYQEDKFNKYYIYRFDSPLQPGETGSIHFLTQRQQAGFQAQRNDTRLVHNGTFLENYEITPTIGMNRNGLLTDRKTRREYDLMPDLRPAKLEEESARHRNYINNAAWVMSDIIISTHKDQTPIAPGKRVFDKVEGDRRSAHFTSTQPILNFFSIQSAQYAEKTSSKDDVNITVYYDKKHDFNVDTMLEASEISLSYFKENFGPYQFDYLRIVEFPGYAQFAQAFAGTVPYSEAIGFIADNRDPNKIDYATYVTAHEVAHQYWGHQLVSSDQQGATLMVETLAQYSALMVMKQIYGETFVHRFLRYELDHYLNARGQEAIEELPLNRVENQGYIHYRKGAVVMYLLQDRLGEGRINAMLSDLLDKYRFQGPPYPRSTDLVEGMKSLARNQGERDLVSDLLEKITLYDLRVTGAETHRLSDKEYETILTIEADKFYLSAEGSETKTTLNDNIEIGLFTIHPDRKKFGESSIIKLEKTPISSGKMRLRLTSKEKPLFAGIDPYNKYIDRVSHDNIHPVKESIDSP